MGKGIGWVKKFLFLNVTFLPSRFEMAERKGKLTREQNLTNEMTGHKTHAGVD